MAKVKFDGNGEVGMRNYYQLVLLTWRASSLLLPFSDTSGDIADDQGSFLWSGFF